MGRIYIDKYTGRIEKSDMYLIRLIMKDGTVYEDLEPRRLFPITNHTMYISLLTDGEKELGFIRDMDEIDNDSRRVLEECLGEYYMIPKIIKVYTSKEEKSGSLRWAVETDRGKIAFTIRNRHSDIKHLHGTRRIIIRDANDNRYEIEDTDKLDAHSTRLLFAYL